MNGSSLIVIQYDAIPGLEQLQGLGSRILGFALLLGLGLEFYRLLTRGSSDFVTPLVKVGLGAAVISSLPAIGHSLGGMSERVSRAMLDASEIQLFGQAFTHAVGQVYEQSTWEAMSTMFSLRGLLVLFGCLLYLAMMIIKLLVIDVLWPLGFSLILVFGCIAVPLGLLPGASVQGWFRTLIEVALWPVIFQVLVAMMVGSFKGLLGQVVALETDQVFGAGLSIDGDPQMAASMGEGLIVVIRFWALCIGYCVLGLGTPVFASMAVRSAAMTAAFGSAAAAWSWGMNLAGRGASWVGRGAMPSGGGSGASSTVGSLGERLAQAAERTQGEARELRGLAWEATDMDQRQYPEPRKEGV